MLDSPRRGKKGKVKAQPEEVTLDQVFEADFTPQAEEVRPELPVVVEEPQAVEATPVKQEIVIDPDRILRFIARLKSGKFLPYGNGSNFANHMVKECFTVGGKSLTIEEASLLIRPFTNVAS